MSRVFLVKAFGRWLRNTELTDADLTDAIKGAESGIVAAQLGGGLVKLRISRENEGKSGGFRTVVAFKSGERSFYLVGFAKNDQDNVSKDDLKRLKAEGKALQRLTDPQIDIALNGGAIREIEPQ